MIELALIIPIYLWMFIIYFKYIKYKYIINSMAEEVVKLLSLLNDNQGLDIPEVDTLEEGVIQHKKREVLKGVIKKGKAHLLGKPWSIDQNR